jgi:hypothetical protein
VGTYTLIGSWSLPFTIDYVRLLYVWFSLQQKQNETLGATSVALTLALAGRVNVIRYLI